MKNFIGASCIKQATREAHSDWCMFKRCGIYILTFNSKVIFIDENKLAEVMLENNIGMSTDKRIRFRKLRVFLKWQNIGG